jgi:DNA replication protein DnaC
VLNTLAAAEATKDLERALRRYVSPALLVLDEVGYLTMSAAEANLFFQVVSRRHEAKRPCALTTNKPFQEWNQVFHRDATAHVIVDRLTERAEIFYLEGESYRKRHRSGLGASDSDRPRPSRSLAGFAGLPFAIRTGDRHVTDHAL